MLLTRITAHTDWYVLTSRAGDKLGCYQSEVGAGRVWFAVVVSQPSPRFLIISSLAINGSMAQQKGGVLDNEIFLCNLGTSEFFGELALMDNAKV